MENDTNTTTETVEPVETQQPQPAQPEAAAEPQPDPKAAVFAELGIDGIYCIQKCDMPESNDVWEEYLHDLGCTRSMCFTQHTVKDFCKKHPHGKYILCTYQHILTVIDGDYYDTWDSGNEIPIYYWKRR